MGFFSCKNDVTKNSTNNILSSRQDIIFPVRALPKNKTANIEEDTLTATVEGISCSIATNGNVLWGQDSAASFQLQTDQIVEKAYLYKNANLLWIFYEETDNETGISRVEKIDLKTKKKIWATNIFGFNLGRPYIIDTTAYVSAIGFAGKLNLGDGNYIYRFTDLYDREKYSFNSFDTILFKDNLAIFISRNYLSNHMDSLIVNEKDHSSVIRK